MPIPVALAITLGLKLAQVGFEAMQNGQEELTPEQEAALRAEGMDHVKDWDDFWARVKKAKEEGN